MKHFLFLFLILVPLTFGFDCSSLNNNKDCLLLNQTNEDLIAGLIYISTSYPDFTFLDKYNNNINVLEPPYNTTSYYQGIIRNAWIEILTIIPSVNYNGLTYVPQNFSVRAEYSYNTILLENYYSTTKKDKTTCKIEYSLFQTTENINIGNKASKIVSFTINKDTNIQATADITATTKKDEYVWYRYCCSRQNGKCTSYCYSCKFQKTSYLIDSLTMSDKVFVKYYNHTPVADFTILNSYLDTNRGVLTKDNMTNVKIIFNNSYYNVNEFEYYATFTNKPYYFLTLNARKENNIDFKNIIISNGSIYVKNSSNCNIESSDFFNHEIKPCNYNITDVNITKIPIQDQYLSLKIALKLAILFVIFLVIKEAFLKYGHRIFLVVAFAFLIMPITFADDNCGITNIASCLPQKIYDFGINLLNAPLEPLLSFTKTLLEHPPVISIFSGVWAIIIYCLSLFYGLLILYSGLLFMFSGHDPIKRAMAKEWLKNTVIMIVMVQASFYLYQLFTDIGSILTTTVLSMVDKHFFMITADNLVNIGLEFFFVGMYVITLFVTVLLLVIRYLVVCLGVILVPIGIFCYFVPPLKSYGKLILHTLGMFIFITFIDVIIILACSMLVNLPIFDNFKIVVMIACFNIINLLFLMLIIKVIGKSIIPETGQNIAEAVKYIGMMA